MTMDSRSGTDSPANCNSLQHNVKHFKTTKHTLPPKKHTFTFLIAICSERLTWFSPELVRSRRPPAPAWSSHPRASPSTLLCICLYLNTLVILFHCVSEVQSANQMRKQSDYLHALLYTTWPEKWPEQEGLLSWKQNKSKRDFRYTMLTQRECSGQMMTSCQDHILTENMWFVWPSTS